MGVSGGVVNTSETRPGAKTTEFWVTLFTNALGVFELVFGGLNVDNENVMIALAVINGLYAASRGIAKQGVPASDVSSDPSA
jgi:hypothetical protein